MKAPVHKFPLIPCVLVLLISNSTETMEAIARFFRERKIPIENLQLHRFRNGNAQVILHVSIERDRIKRTSQLFKALPGILEVQWMEAKS
jgi:hypothetical protein